MTGFVRPLDSFGKDDVDIVGGKNASLGEMLGALKSKGVRVPDGLAVTVAGYREFIGYNDLDDLITATVDGLDVNDDRELARAGEVIRRAVGHGEFPATLADQIRDRYAELSQQFGMEEADVAVRSSATAEDLPDASLAGQQETMLNVTGGEDVGEEAEEHSPIIDRKLGSKLSKDVHATGEVAATKVVDCRRRERESFVLEDHEVIQLARWGAVIEQHYGHPMDIEWAKDGDTGDLFVVQARPETVQSRLAEIPANVFLADQFAERFDGFSIGSNDMTQLVLGVDRDSSQLAHLFDERNPAVLAAIERVISEAKGAGRKVGICGQGPSDHPDLAEFLVRQDIDSIAVNPDALVNTRRVVAAIEAEMGGSA